MKEYGRPALVHILAQLIIYFPNICTKVDIAILRCASVPAIGFNSTKGLSTIVKADLNSNMASSIEM
jgi:hypothetical protein